MSRPPCTTLPSSCVSRPAMIRRRVVLPQPEGPRKVTSCPRSIASAMSWSAVNLPKRLVTPASRRYGSPESGADAVPRTLKLFRERLRVVALGPLGEDLVAVLRFPREVVLHQPLLVIGGDEIERLGDARDGDHREVLGEELHRSRRREPVHQLARCFHLLGRLHDAGGLEVPPKALAGENDVDRRSRLLGRHG